MKALSENMRTTSNERIACAQHQGASSAASQHAQSSLGTDSAPLQRKKTKKTGTYHRSGFLKRALVMVLAVTVLATSVPFSVFADVTDSTTPESSVSTTAPAGNEDAGTGSGTGAETGAVAETGTGTTDPAEESGVVADPAEESGVVADPAEESGEVADPAEEFGEVADPAEESGVVADPVEESDEEENPEEEQAAEENPENAETTEEAGEEIEEKDPIELSDEFNTILERINKLPKTEELAEIEVIDELTAYAEEIVSIKEAAAELSENEQEYFNAKYEEDMAALLEAIESRAEEIANEEDAFEFTESPYIDDEIDVEELTHKKKLMMAVKSAVQTDISEIPESFDLRDVDGESYVTYAKDQGDYSTCWSFAALAAAESNYLMSGGSNSDIDLSELQLAWFMYNNIGVSDRLGLITNDGTSAGEDSLAALNVGGNPKLAALAMASGIGPVDESKVPYAEQVIADLSADPDAYKDLCYDSDYLLTASDWYAMSETETIKKAIMQSGALAVYCYFNGENSFYDSEEYDEPAKNHAVTIIGWDDNYDLNNFTNGKDGKLPENNGAWLVKNSSGSEYAWISYDEYSLKSGSAAGFSITDKEKDYDIFQYDGSANTAASHKTGSRTYYFDAIYQADHKEKLDYVGLTTYQSQINYEISIYTGYTDKTNPKGGNLLYSETGKLENAGYHLIELEDEIIIDRGTEFAVVVKYTSANGNVIIPVDKSNEATIKHVNSSEPGQTYFSKYGSTFSDYYDLDNSSARLKVLADRLYSDEATEITDEINEIKEISETELEFDVSTEEKAAEAKEKIEALLGRLNAIIEKYEALSADDKKDIDIDYIYKLADRLDAMLQKIEQGEEELVGLTNWNGKTLYPYVYQKDGTVIFKDTTSKKFFTSNSGEFLGGFDMNTDTGRLKLRVGGGEDTAPDNQDSNENGNRAWLSTDYTAPSGRVLAIEPKIKDVGVYMVPGLLSRDYAPDTEHQNISIGLNWSTNSSYNYKRYSTGVIVGTYGEAHNKRVEFTLPFNYYMIPVVDVGNITVTYPFDGTEKTNGYTTPTGISVTGTTKATAPGTYTATYTPKENAIWVNSSTAAPYYTSGYIVDKKSYESRTITLVINNVADFTTEPSAKSGTFTYNGSGQTLFNAGTVRYTNTTAYYGFGSSSTSAPTSWTTSIPTAKDYGTYYLWAKIESTNQDIGPMSAKYIGSKTISKKSITPSLSYASTPYSGSAQKPTTSFTGLAGTDSLTSGTDYTATFPSDVTSCGTKTVTFALKSTTKANNYTLSTTSASYTIDKIDSPFTVGNKTIYVNGSVDISTLVSGKLGTLSYAVKTSPTSGGTGSLSGSTYTAGVGVAGTDTDRTCVINVTDSGDTNHKSTTKTATITIQKYTPTITFSNSTTSVQVDKTLSVAATRSTSGGTAGTLSYSTSSDTYLTLSSSTVTGKKYSGSTTTTITATAASTTTNKKATKTRTITVAKGDSTMTVTTPQSWSPTYKNSAQTKALTAAANAKGSITYSVSKQVIKGTNTAVNYFSFASASTPTISMNAATPAGEYTVTVTAKDAGSSDYNSKESDITFNVTVGNATLTVTAPDQTFTYDGSPHGNAITATGVDGKNATVMYRITSSGGYNLSSAPQITNVAESKTIHWQATLDNHTSQTGSYKITINKATPVVTKATVYDNLSFNNNPQSLISGGSTTGGTLQYALGTSATGAPASTATWKETLDQQTDAGDYYIWYKVVGDSNWNNVTATYLGKAVIAKATINASATSGVATWDGNATNGGAKVEVTLPASGYTVVYGTSSGTYDLDSIPTYTNAGTYTVYYKITAPNYNDKEASFTITIDRAVLGQKPTDPASITYDREEHSNGVVYNDNTYVIKTGDTKERMPILIRLHIHLTATISGMMEA